MEKFEPNIKRVEYNDDQHVENGAKLHAASFDKDGFTLVEQTEQVSGATEQLIPEHEDELSMKAHKKETSMSANVKGYTDHAMKQDRKGKSIEAKNAKTNRPHREWKKAS